MLLQKSKQKTTFTRADTMEPLEFAQAENGPSQIGIIDRPSLMSNAMLGPLRTIAKSFVVLVVSLWFDFDLAIVPRVHPPALSTLRAKVFCSFYPADRRTSAKSLWEASPDVERES